VLDMVLLRILKNRKEFFQIHDRIPKEALDKTTVMIIEDFAAYFEKLPDATKIDVQYFLPFFRSRRGKDMSEEGIIEYERILPKLRTNVPEDERKAIMVQMLELRLSTDMAETLSKYEAGDIPNLHAELTRIENEFAVDAEIKVTDFIKTPIEELMLEEGNEDGIKSRLTVLKEAMRGYRGGDFVIIAARPDRGKGTFIASETTYFAPQLPDDQNILILNNEGPGKRVVPRLYQAALGAPLSVMREYMDDKSLRRRYIEAVGRVDRIRVVDIHGFDTYAVENIVRQNNAGVVVYDMIDHIRGFRNEARTDLVLEEMYKWARTLAVKYNHVGMATSQISNEGDGMLFPTLGMLKDSKTGKQGACDAMIMIGNSNDPGMQSIRGIGLPKNKLRREGFPGDPRAQVTFKPGIARFEDMAVGLPGDEEEDET